jgi:hypothetical protein
MKKVISFTIYQAPKSWEQMMETNYEKYILGLNKNLELIKEFYPEWYVYLYHDDTLDTSKLNELYKYDKFESKLISDKSLNAMQWRFLPNDDEDVELFISRDADSRVSEREQVSVLEWIESGKILHIMRDHPHHGYHILGGMWGMRRQPDFNMKDECLKYNQSKNYNSEIHWYDKWWDMNFLGEVLYPIYVSNSYINSETGHAAEPWNREFTIKREDRKFVGEIYDENNNRAYQYTILNN